MSLIEEKQQIPCYSHWFEMPGDRTQDIACSRYCMLKVFTYFIQTIHSHCEFIFICCILVIWYSIKLSNLKIPFYSPCFELQGDCTQTWNYISILSWQSVLLVEESGVSGENHKSVTGHWQTLSHNVVSSTLHHERDSNLQL